jgi:hypothetical protein
MEVDIPRAEADYDRAGLEVYLQTLPVSLSSRLSAVMRRTVVSLTQNHVATITSSYERVCLHATRPLLRTKESTCL